jgi:uncharacterized protein YgiM (DUF1202 family)
MAKLQTVASRAEAASGMAEAELAVQSLKTSATVQVPETGQATQLLQTSTVEFDRQNYGGALYLANQAKAMAAAGKSRLALGDRNSRPGDVPFAVPVRLETQGRANVREGPGTKFSVLFTIETGTSLTGYSHADDWIRIGDGAGRTGWVFQALVSRPRDGTR